jgi:NDP-sugar pyrophosphorylase family protein
MQAIILAGGQGTRLRKLYPDRPKALVPILFRPFISRQLNELASAGIHSVHIAAGYMASAIRDWMPSGAPKNMTVTLSEEPSHLGTAGGLKHIEDLIQTNPFVVVNGDSLLPNLDWHEFMETHRLSSATVTLAVTQVNEAGRYGTVEFDASNLVTAFLEKTERKSGWINGGLYIMNQETMRHIAAGRTFSLEKDVFPVMSWLRTLQVYKSAGPLLDMGTPEGIQQMEKYLSTHGG